MPPLDADACYRALIARDARFDGLFFVGVQTTGIYCRPVCPARTPGRDRCRFFQTAAQAEAAGFRACFRCRPESAPGPAPIDALSRVVAAAMRRIEEGALSDDDSSVDQLARELGVSGRHLRRAMAAELGLSPLALAESRRLGLARQLLADTALPITEVAFASGYRSLRRFNAAVKARFARPPSAMRRERRNGAPFGSAGASLTLALQFRPPYDWRAMMAYLAARALPGVEQVQGGVYLRTAAIGDRHGWVSVEADPSGTALRATVSTSLAGALMAVVARLRRLFDLDAQPAAIAAHLARDPRLAPSVRARPGLRLVGAFDPFEAAIRAVLGQQISVGAARTIAGRLAARLGAPVATPHPALTRLFPGPAVLAAAPAEALATLGLPGRRATTLRTIATAVADGRLSLDAGAEPGRLVEQATALPGVGGWTAHVLAMRALGWPDAFPEEDLGLRRALGNVSAARARVLAERWHPWRAYAATHLWTELAAATPARAATATRAAPLERQSLGASQP